VHVFTAALQPTHRPHSLPSLALAAKVDAIRNGTGLVLQCRKQQRFDPMVMDASSKLLKVVPEVRRVTATSQGPSSLCRFLLQLLFCACLEW